MRQPSALATKKGLPPTPRKARTGLLTPPGITRCALSKSASEPCADMAPGSSISLPPIDGSEVAERRVPAERPRLHHAAVDDREHHVGRVGIGRLAVDEGVVPVGGREIRAGIDVRVVDRQYPEALRFVAPHG